MSKEKAMQKINAAGGQGIEKKKAKKVVIVAACIVGALLLILILWLLLRKEALSNVVVTPDNVQDIIDAQNEKEQTRPGSYLVSMNTDWVFKDGKSVSDNATIANSPKNTNTVYFDITLEGSDEIIYTSPDIPVGSSLEDLKLEKDLQKGTYNGIVTYHLLDEDGISVSKVSVSITITIQK